MRIMNKIYSILAAFLVATAVVASAPAADARRTDQQKARQQMKSGELIPFADIERNVKARMRNMEYLGAQFNARNSTYRFKFLEKNRSTQTSRVVHVDVDAKTGAILSTR